MKIRNALCVLLCTFLCSMIQGQGYKKQKGIISVLVQNDAMSTEQKSVLPMKRTNCSASELSCLDCCDVCSDCPTTKTPPSPKKDAVMTFMLLQKYNLAVDDCPTTPSPKNACPTTPSPVKKRSQSALQDCLTPIIEENGLSDVDSDSDVDENMIRRATSFLCAE